MIGRRRRRLGGGGTSVVVVDASSTTTAETTSRATTSSSLGIASSPSVVASPSLSSTTSSTLLLLAFLILPSSSADAFAAFGPTPPIFLPGADPRRPRVRDGFGFGTTRSREVSILAGARPSSSSSERRPRRRRPSHSSGRRSGRGRPSSPFRPTSSPSTDAGDDEVVPVDPSVNLSRLHRSRIDCVHFGQCPGCVRDSRVGNVNVIRSAKLYFGSSAVRRNRLDYSDDDDDDWDEDEEDDDFYRVVVPSELTRWRTQAKLAVSSSASGQKSAWKRGGGCSFGLYERGSHRVLPIPECQVHHPSVNRAVAALTSATESVRTVAYDEDSGEGGLRYVQLQVERSTGKVCLTLIWNAERTKDAQPGLTRLTKELKRLEPKLWHSIWFHGNDSVGNAIFGRGEGRWARLDGPEFVREPLPTVGLLDEDDEVEDGAEDEGGREQRRKKQKHGLLHFTPTTFRQGNLDGFDIIASHVARIIPGGSKVCELYAGVGVLGLTALSYRHRTGEPLVWLRCSDENPANPRCFRRSVDSMPSEVTGRPPRSRRDGRSRRGGNDGKGRRRRNGNRDDDGGSITVEEMMQQMLSNEASGAQGTGTGTKGKVSYVVSSASRAILDGQALGADVLIVDPPRKGLDDGVLIELCKPVNPNQDYVEDAMLLTDRDRGRVNLVNDVRTVVYVSCGFDALARDSDRLLSGRGGGWKLDGATGYVLFPGSDHVETVAVFRR